MVFQVYMYIDIGERIDGKKDWPTLFIEGPPGTHEYNRMQIFLHCDPYMKNGGYVFPCYAYIYMYICSVVRSYCPDIVIPLGST